MTWKKDEDTRKLPNFSPLFWAGSAFGGFFWTFIMWIAGYNIHGIVPLVLLIVFVLEFLLCGEIFEYIEDKNHEEECNNESP